MICPHIKTTPEVVNYINKFNTDEELLRSGGLPTNMLDRLAFGFSDEDIKTLNPDQLNVKWHDDMDNVKWEQQKSGLSKVAWAKTINLSEPIDVVFEKNKFYIDDGHHRTYAAKILKQPLNVNLDIRMNPITALTPKLGYDDFHRCLFKQIKNMNLNEQLNRMKSFMGIEEDYPENFSLEEFKKLTSFKKRLEYCNKNLQRISSGSSRALYKIDEEKVLKLAMNQKGIAQNEQEIILSNYYDISDIVAHVFDKDDKNNTWLEMELARKLTLGDFKRITGFDFKDFDATIHNYYLDAVLHRNDFRKEVDKEISQEMWENEFTYSILNFIGSYQIPAGDLG
jgi:hypothetical protein